MKSTYLTMAVALGLGMAFAPGMAMATDTSDGHDVSVQVLPYDEMSADEDLLIVLDGPYDSEGYIHGSGSATLEYTTNKADQKIQIEASVDVALGFDLTVEATNCAGLGDDPGDGVGEVFLDGGLLATDFITEISQTAAMCDLEYTADAFIGDGNGTETWTVLFTIMDE